jgi:hypothetical protein
VPVLRQLAQLQVLLLMGANSPGVPSVSQGDTHEPKRLSFLGTLRISIGRYLLPAGRIDPTLGAAGEGRADILLGGGWIGLLAYECIGPSPL